MNKNITLAIRDDDHKKGNHSGKIQVILYSDFQCPFCLNANFALDRLIETYQDKICIAFRHYPQIEFHEQSLLAACSAEAASNQDKFWEMHDLLFKNQKNLNPYMLYELAHSIGLNPDKFHQDINSPNTQDKIFFDIASCKDNGISGTPSFIINGDKHIGEWTYKSLRSHVDSMLLNLK